MAYQIQVRDVALSELEAIRPFDQRRIVAEIERQLTHEPARRTRNRKRMDTLRPLFEHVPPIRELRVGQYRVFYDVDEATQTVYVRAVRRKGPHQTTEDLIE